MKLKQYFRWELVLALSLVGCTSVVPNQLGLPSLTKGETSGANSVAAKKSSLFFQVRWPERKGFQTQEIPDLTKALEVSVKAKDGTPIDSKTITRPTDGSNLSDVVFNLDPTLKVVDINVRALDDAGNEVAFGQKLDVQIRDNTATGVTVTLIAGTTQQAKDQLQIEINRKLVLLHDVKNYFSRFDQLAKYGESPEVKDLNGSMQAMFQSWPFKDKSRDQGYYTPAPYYPGDGTEPSPYPSDGSYQTPPPDGTTTTRYGVRTIAALNPDGTTRLVNPNDSTVYLDFLDGVAKKLYWPGAIAALEYLDEGALHKAGVLITGNDQTTAELKLGVTAGTWVPEASLKTELDGLIDGQPATASLTFFGGLKPDERSITLVTVGASVVPKGIQANRFHLGAVLDTPRDVSGSPLFRIAQQAAPKPYYPSPTAPVAGYPSTGYPSPGYPGGNYGPQQPMLPSYLPTHARFFAHAPAAQATADVRLSDDMLGVQSRTELRVRDNLGAFSSFLLELGATAQTGTVGGQPAIVSGDFGFSLVDKKEELKLEGVVHGDMTTQKAIIQARFVDVPSNTVLGTLDWTFDPKGDPNHLAYWPELKLQDGNSYRLTPGFFSGQTTGNVRVDVR